MADPHGVNAPQGLDDPWKTLYSWNACDSPVITRNGGKTSAFNLVLD